MRLAEPVFSPERYFLSPFSFLLFLYIFTISVLSVYSTRAIQKAENKIIHYTTVKNKFRAQISYVVPDMRLYRTVQRAHSNKRYINKRSDRYLNERQLKFK